MNNSTLAIAFFALVLLLISSWVIRDRLRLSRHSGRSKSEFVAFFQARGIPENLSTAVYEHYRSLGSGAGFQANPDDDLGAVLNEEPDEIEDDLRSIARSLKLEISDEQLWADQSQVRTIGDVVVFLHRLKSSS